MSNVGKLNSIKQAPLAEKSNQATEKQIKEVADMYEKYFIREMMKQMRATVHQEDGVIKRNNAEKIFTDQLDDQYADQWGKAGGIGLSGLIYDQIIDKYGVSLGLKKPLEKPMGPMKLDQKSNFSGITSPSAAGSKSGDPLTFRLESPAGEKSQLTNPWAGTLLDKKYLEMDQMQYHIKHDNGLESLIVTRGSGLGPEQKLSPGDTIGAGEQLGWLSESSPLFWTLKANVSE
jgi:flagellar protein FlgJ